MINFDNVDDYVVVDNFMPKKFCKEYIEKSTKLQWKKHVWTEHDKPDKFFANDEDMLKRLINAQKYKGTATECFDEHGKAIVRVGGQI